MKILKKYQHFLCISGIGCLIAGLSLLFIPMVDLEGTTQQKIFALILAALFWIGMIVEIVFFVLADKQCNMIEDRLIKEGSKSFKGTKIGVISFFTCKEAMVADVLTGLSLIAIILMIILKVTNDWLFVIVAVIFFFSFNLHCFLNGRNYKYIKEIKKFIKKQGAEKDA